MDKSWMNKSRLTRDYEKGLDQFLDMAFNNVCLSGKIVSYCKNVRWVNRETAKEHLTVDGFMKGYTHWVVHGEDSSYAHDSFQQTEHLNMFDDMHNLVHDAFGVNNEDGNIEEEPNEQADAFYKLLEDAQEELYLGCKQFPKLKFIVRLFQIKSRGKWSNKSFTNLLKLLKEAFPELMKSLPESYYEVQKIIGLLGLTCIKTHACPNDCMLYWKEHENDTRCYVFNASRYNEASNNLVEKEGSSKRKKIPAKVLRYFPLRPRLQRLFMSSKTASFMRWHKEECTKDGNLRHPSDLLIWHAFDRQHREFAKR